MIEIAEPRFGIPCDLFLLKAHIPIIMPLPCALRDLLMQPVQKKDRKRLLLIFFGILLLFTLLISQYYVVQIEQGAHWEQMAARQHYFTVSEPFIRGTFYSNPLLQNTHPDQPQKLALDVQKHHLFADPESIPPSVRPLIVEELKTRLSLNKEQTAHLASQLEKKSRSRKLASWLERAFRENLLEWWHPFARKHHLARNALFFVADYQRSYPFGTLLGQVLQTVQHGRDEKTGQATPTGGLELSFNKYLSGHKGKRLMMRSPRNALEVGEMIQLPEDGADVYLTINHVLQAIAEEEIAKAVKTSNAKGGWAVMMNPYSGEILALAQYPFFNPVHYADFFNDPDKRDALSVKAVSDAQEPGSVMKPITLCVALLANAELKQRGETPLFSPTEKMATFDGRFPGRKPLKEITYHHFLNMNMGLQKSSNIYMARLIERVINRLGNDWYRETLQRVFGFGEKTKMELPGESAGVLPTPGKLHPNGALEWSVPTPFSLAIGHNIQTTSLQLLRAYALIANGGRLVKPTLLRQIAKPTGEEKHLVLVDREKERQDNAFPQLLDPEMATAVVTAMKYVTKKGGSGIRAAIPGYTAAGKTGTAEKIVNGTYSHHHHVATFIGFAPIERPEFVLLVAIDEPEVGYVAGIGKRHMGGVAAAPVFREIGKRALAYLGTTPDDPHQMHWRSEVEALQQLYETWNRKAA